MYDVVRVAFNCIRVAMPEARKHVLASFRQAHSPTVHYQMCVVIEDTASIVADVHHPDWSNQHVGAVLLDVKIKYEIMDTYFVRTEK